MQIEPATEADVEFMWHMLYYASHSHHEAGVSLDDIQQNPDLIRHIGGWPNRPGDRGIIARADGRPVGACWLRLIIPSDKDDGTFYDAQTPELVISVEPDWIGQGVGSRLLAVMLHAADWKEIPAIVLTARASNPAVALYERHGFEVIEHLTNRVGTESVKMLRRCARE